LHISFADLDLALRPASAALGLIMLLTPPAVTAAIARTGHDRRATRMWEDSLKNIRIFSGTALASAIVLLPVMAAAQSAPPAESTPPADAAAAGSGLQEIVVTAQRRSESAQKVPLAVQAFDSAKLASTGAATTQDLPSLVPGLTLQVGGGGSESIFIRGVGNGGTVLKYVDGILDVFGQVSSSFGANLASVEVDKGPQSTLFGRNATGGVVQFHTKDPSDTPSLEATLGMANYGTVNANLYASGSLAKDLKTDLAVSYDNQADGWGHNLDTGAEIYRNRKFSVRSKTVYDPGNDFKVTLSVDHRYVRTDVGNVVGPMVGRDTLYNEVTGGSVSVPGKYNTDTNVNPFSTSEMNIIGLTVEKTLSFAKFTSITSWQNVHLFLSLDYDGSPINFATVNRADQDQALTQEFQLASLPGSGVRWVVGAFYLNESNWMRPFDFSGAITSLLGAPSGSTFDVTSNTKLQSYALYAQATVPLTPTTKVTLGARYTIDHNSLYGFDAYGTDVIAGSPGGASITFRKPTFKADIEQQITPHIFGYASYNRGYNSGGFNNLNTGGYAPSQISNVKPETIDAWEAGLKTNLIGNTLRLNLAAFLYNYQNMQQQIYESGSLFTVNAASARIKGIDADLEARPFRDLVISGGLGWLDAYYTNYPDAPFYSYAASGALTSSSGNAAGNTMVSAPKLGLNGTVRHTLHTGIGQFVSAATATYSAKWYADASNNIVEPAHTLVNLTETWTAPDGKTSVNAFVKNLGNVYYDAGINILAPVGAFSEPGAPRTYGVSLTRRF
jgi:iron complex outermembrane recepter protein